MGFLNVLAEAIDAMGSADFEKRLADAVGQLVSHDFISMVRYSTSGKPCFLIHSHTFPSHLAELYLSDYTADDPYAEHWRQTRQPGVVWLKNVVQKDEKHLRYKDTFLPQIGVADEIGCLMPAVGSDSIAFFYNKRLGEFQQSEFAVIEEWFEAIAALYRQHIRAVISARNEVIESPSFGRPLRMTNDTGSTIWVTNEWRAQQGPNVSEIRTNIAEDFGVHDRFLWTLPPSDDQSYVPRITYVTWADQIGLTRREKDIVALTLQGHGSDGIARHLNLSVGNIKNHKRRIYSKLDITSERELFLMYIEAMAIRH